jgi:hypothetical protein
MAIRKRATADLIGIRERRTRFQVRIFGGIDPATGKQLILRDSAATEVEAIALRDGFREQVARPNPSMSSPNSRRSTSSPRAPAPMMTTCGRLRYGAGFSGPSSRLCQTCSPPSEP